MIIDIHAHLWAGSYKNDRDRILEACRLFSIQRVYVSSLSSYYPDKEEIEMLNGLTREFMRDFPDLVGGFVHIDPRHANKMDVMKKAVEEDGMEGVKLWVSVLCDDPGVNEIAEKCIDYDIPMLVHSFHKDTGQLEFESTGVHVRNLALRYPGLRIIMAHMGGNAYHGLRCVYDLDNVYPDISGTPSGKGEIEYALELIGGDRLLFGTDMPMGGRQCIARIEDLQADDSTKRNIFYNNALKVLGRRQ